MKPTKREIKKYIKYISQLEKRKDINIIWYSPKTGYPEIAARGGHWESFDVDIEDIEHGWQGIDFNNYQFDMSVTYCYYEEHNRFEKIDVEKKWVYVGEEYIFDVTLERFVLNYRSREKFFEWDMMTDESFWYLLIFDISMLVICIFF